MSKLFENSGDLDQMLHSGASEWDLHCNYPFTIFRLQWVKKKICQGPVVQNLTLIANVMLKFLS